jgi:hypothetical protein
LRSRYAVALEIGNRATSAATMPVTRALSVIALRRIVFREEEVRYSKRRLAIR